MTFDEYVAKKRLNERDRQALEQYVHSLGSDRMTDLELADAITSLLPDDYREKLRGNTRTL